MLMFKKKLIFFLILFFYLNNSFAEKIEQININGNNRITTETIKVFLNIDIGDEIYESDLNLLLKNLYDTNFFKDIVIKLENSVLSVELVENKIIRTVEFKGIKSKQLITKLEKEIKSKSNESFIDTTVKNDQDYISTILKDNGFYLSKVSTLIRDNSDNTIDLTFDIELGKKTFIKKIIFTGNKKFKKEKLLNVITSEENKFWKFISNKRLLNKERINLDIRLIENFYKNKGYYQAKVLDQSIQSNDNQNFNLIFNIDAGKKFYFSDLSIVLPEDYDPTHFKNILKKINSYSNKIYSFKILENLLKEIESVASINQYDFVNANITHQVIEDNKVAITINIIDDSYKYYVEKINIIGNTITVEDVIRNQLLVDEGDPLNQVLFNKSINNIKSLGIFKNVNSKIIDSNDDSLKVIEIEVEEKPTGEIALGAGLGTSGASTIFGVKENNFLGKNIKLDSNIYLSQETIRGLFSYENPNFNNSDREFIFTLESSETNRITNFGYKTKKNGFLVGTGLELYEDFYFKPSISFYNENIETASSASNLLQRQQGNYLDLDFKYNILFDKRDQKFQPTYGYLSSFYQKIPLNVSENQTIINSYEISKYVEYLDDIVATFSFFGQAANSIGDEDVRISNRLFMPSKKLRGFESGKIGPVDGGDFVGGNYSSSVNFSTNIPLLPSMDNISFNFFFDAANVWGVDYNSSINDSNLIRTSTGIGADWYTPIGPLNFSLAQPLSKKSTDITETFRFNIGTTF